MWPEGGKKRREGIRVGGGGIKMIFYMNINKFNNKIVK